MSNLPDWQNWSRIALKVGLYNLGSLHFPCLNYHLTFSHIQIVIHTFRLRNNVSNETYRPNLCPLMHAPMITPVGVRMFRPVNQSSSSKDQSKGQKINKDGTQLDPIPLSYAELFPKLLEKGLIELVHLPSLRPLFSKWYKADAHCDYHAGNHGHSLENCTAFKYKVQESV